MSIYELASDFTSRTNRSLFITGKAGTGKTTFLHRLQMETTKQMAIVAPTGVAAINAGGVTIHSFFQLPFAPFLPTPEGEAGLISKLKMNSARRKVIRELELLVIDEVSMVRADVLDAIDAVLRYVRHRRYEPFGGVQMVFIGDMYQLSPVARGEEWSMLSTYYRGIYFFNSKVYERQKPVYIEFDKIFRQSDGKFIELLNQVRNDSLTDQGMSLLQSRYVPNFRPSADDFHITLTTHNSIADKINVDELAKIKKKPKLFKATVKGQFFENAFPSDELLELKEGARVMFVKNDTEQPRRFYNGKIGTVSMIDDVEEIIFVTPDDPDEDVIAVTKMSWENVVYSTNDETLQIEEEVVGVFTQYPLRLAWAITIHKSQGLTFDKAIIDAGSSFAPGQVYVALSRCRTLEGITLLSPISRHKINNDAQVVEFSSQVSNEKVVKEQFKNAQQEYRSELILNLFNFDPILHTSKLWHRDVLEIESSFNEETLTFIRLIINQLTEIESVSARFQNQLKGIFAKSPLDEAFLKERITAASVFFDDKLDVVIDTLYESPASTDSRANAKAYDDRLNEIFSFVSQKRYIINGIVENSSIERYFDLRKSFKLNRFNVTSHAKASTGRKLKSEHPELLSQLIQTRNKLADKENTPIYIVANTESLVEMSNYMPHSEERMLRISGIGKKRFERFGVAFLEVINRYISLHGIEISEVLPPERKEKKKSKPKTVKGASSRETLRLYDEGKSIEEIAKERQLVEGTITSHLSQFVKSGEVDILKFLTQDQIDKATDIIAKKQENVSNYAVLRDHYSTVELNFLMAFFRENKDKE